MKQLIKNCLLHTYLCFEINIKCLSFWKHQKLHIIPTQCHVSNTVKQNGGHTCFTYPNPN